MFIRYILCPNYIKNVAAVDVKIKELKYCDKLSIKYIGSAGVRVNPYIHNLRRSLFNESYGFYYLFLDLDAIF